MLFYIFILKLIQVVLPLQGPPVIQTLYMWKSFLDSSSVNLEYNLIIFCFLSD